MEHRRRRYEVLFSFLSVGKGRDDLSNFLKCLRKYNSFRAELHLWANDNSDNHFFCHRNPQLFRGEDIISEIHSFIRF